MVRDTPAHITQNVLQQYVIRLLDVFLLSSGRDMMKMSWPKVIGVIYLS